MLLKNGYVIHPQDFLVPGYSIGPFCLSSARVNREVQGGANLEAMLKRRFSGMAWAIFPNGRSALASSLRHIGLNREDNVAIFTTTGNDYISSCVTREVEKHCLWGRAVDARTRAILVNHEFGFPCEDMQRFKLYGLPIIEDFAHSFLSANSDRTAGSAGDYLVFSFSKIFPIQVGGMLLAREIMPVDGVADPSLRDYILRIVGYWLGHEEEIRDRRRANHNYLESKFRSLGCAPRFRMEEFHVPGVFMFKAEPRLDLGLMKRHFQANGVESSVFYPEQSFYIPVHQNLEKFDLDFFSTLAEVFMEQSHGRSLTSSWETRRGGPIHQPEQCGTRRWREDFEVL